MPETNATPSSAVAATIARAGEEAPQRVDMRIPLRTFIHIFAALLTAYAFYALWPLLLLVLLALFLAVTLNAMVDWLETRGMARWGSLAVVVGCLFIALGAGLAFIVPALFDQAAVISHSLPRLQDEALSQIPMSDAARQNVGRLIDKSNWPEAGAWIGHLWSAGGIALGGITQIALLLIIALYLLIDGQKIYDWMLAFFSPLHRSKIRATSKAVSSVMFGYVAGQAITSALVAIYSYTLLSILGVPAPFMLAILAGVFDVLPLLGLVYIASQRPNCSY